MQFISNPDPNQVQTGDLKTEDLVATGQRQRLRRLLFLSAAITQL